MSGGRSKQTFVMDAIVRKGDKKRQSLAHRRDINAVTAPIIVEAAQRILTQHPRSGAFFPGCDSVTPLNGLRLVFHPQGLRPFIENCDVLAAPIIRRVHCEAADNRSNETLKRFLEELLSYPGVPSRWRILDLDGTPPPFLTINHRWKNSTLRWFSMLTTLGTPMGVALQELRIETLFPADETTRTVVNRLAEECLASQTA